MTNIKRLALTGLAALSLLVAGAAEPAAAAETIFEVADGVYSYAPRDGYISMFVVTSEGVIGDVPISVEIRGAGVAG